MTTATHRFRTAAAALSLIGVLSITACAPLTAEASTAASTSITAGATAASSASAENASATAAAEETITATAAAAQEFLATLSAEQREQVLYAYDDESRTTSWSNFPVTFVERAGLNLAELTEEQQAAALGVLEALLSEEGYATVTDIMGGDQFLAQNSSSTEESLGQYYIAFFGDPSDTGAWEVQFGGHHLGINATLNGAEDSITFAPTHLGSQPAVYTDGQGNEVQPLAGMYETAFAFYDSLSEEQQAALYQGEQVGNLVCAPGGACDYPTGTGIAGSELTEEQQQLLLDVIAQWVGLADEQTTAEELATIEASLDETYVNWSGATAYDMSTGDGIYFQISGPDVYIEFADQQGSAGADVTGYTTAGWGHIHTIYRDPADDYAGAVTQQEATGMGGPGGAPAGAPAGTAPANG
ncbi:DUF3500 domain-containing protein [Kocuria sediminis]|uniref:DUF3500 domain-containing protein n=1 Tax=Kocuria sediminis TaxID=1038857 RepID=A0A6N8GQR2_9MICC|nr:DUF3500 domain-containing protein [Kocuria sediminis]MUN64610.1 DUF3500 domain-containing protein [Kocuria sediminis]